jgi:hypothetical protein
MILVNDDGEVMLSEVEALNERQLQERLKDSPDLLPIEELGLTGPLLVVGRETTLPSGAADLLALAPTGDVVVIEMKTGPQNSDFRAALAQATDEQCLKPVDRLGRARARRRVCTFPVGRVVEVSSNGRRWNAGPGRYIRAHSSA